MDIKSILQTQKEYQEKLGQCMDTEIGAVKENMLAIIAELMEVTNELNWKPWATSTKVVNKTALALELVDVLLFYANIVNATGITYQELHDAYYTKRRILNERLSKCS